MYSDPFQAWSPALHCDSTGVDRLRPIPSYEERLRNNEGSAPYADMIIERSDPAKIRRFNELAQEFNGELPQIKAGRNIQRAQQIARQAWEIITAGRR